jgi:hypothetical protein
MINRVAALGGRMLRAVFAGLLILRRPRPIHPRGVALTGTVRWLPGAVPAGLEWVDRPPTTFTQVVTARMSRSVGLPIPWPDIIGLALRFSTPAGSADLELASTGFGFPSRFWLAPQRSPSKARLTTLLPYQGENGPVLIGARTLSPHTLPPALSEVRAALERASWTLCLYHATPTGRWHPFATIELTSAPGPIDSPLRFDAGRNPLPGSREYGWVRALRDPSYRRVQG